MMVYPQMAHLEHFEPRRTRHSQTGGGYIARVGRWLRESFWWLDAPRSAADRPGPAVTSAY